MDEMMFCYQCEQAANCTACTGKAGVCGKSAETADAQDKLTGALIGFATLLLDIGRPIRPPQALLLTEGLFTTITNVNFDPQTVAQLTDKVWKAKQEAFASASPAPAPVSDYDMQKLWQEPDPDRKSLCSFVLFGLRGMAAYSFHARVLGYTDGEIDLFFCTALRAIAQERDKDKLFQLVEDTGRMAYRVMAELDKANTGAFGDPEPVEVSLTIEKGPFIVISGHDLYDAKCLLEQTEGKGINVYTHSEMATLAPHGRTSSGSLRTSLHRCSSPPTASCPSGPAMPTGYSPPLSSPIPASPTSGRTGIFRRSLPRRLNWAATQRTPSSRA